MLFLYSYINKVASYYFFVHTENKSTVTSSQLTYQPTLAAAAILVLLKLSQLSIYHHALPRKSSVFIGEVGEVPFSTTAVKISKLFSKRKSISI